MTDLFHTLQYMCSINNRSWRN